MENSLDEAAVELDKVLKLNSTHERAKTRAVDSARREVERVLAEIEDVETEQAGYEITAPVDGVVQHGDTTQRWRQNEVQVGATIHEGRILMTIPDTSVFKIVINVPEADIARLATGQVGTIWVDAVASRSFTGRVTQVAEAANAGGWISTDVKEFAVELDMPSTPGLKPGFSCRAEIITDTVEDALLVPIQGVFRDGQDFVVYPVKGRTRSQPVSIGQSSVSHVQILDGLAEGDAIYLSRPADGD
ncbi:MAG: efflux RND transporter periplasmic adaptor subunit [Verrucomicrobia bacterium]|nr:efflux RND transporter periplasmic adaptor subunit [Verrucomicrobiota bacterium]